MDLDSVELDKLVTSLRTQRDWIIEVRNLESLIDELDRLNKVTSVRELSKLIDKSKSWIGVSFVLIKGLKLYPEIEKFRTRNRAYEFLLRKNKLRKFLES